MKKFIIVVEASFLGVKYIADAIRNLNYEPIFLTNFWCQEGDALTQLSFERAIFCETTDVNEIKKTVEHLGIKNVIGITTFLDSRLAIVASVCKDLKIPGVSEAVIRLKGKSYVNNIIPEFVPKSFSFKKNVTHIEQLKDFIMESNGSEFIAKPSFTAGAIGTFLFHNYNEFVSEIEQASDKVPNYLGPDQFVVQEFVEGDLVSIEGYVYESSIKFIGATKRFKFKNTEVKHQFPYQEVMSGDAYDKCMNVVSILIKRARFEYGFFHVEFIVKDDEVKLIDANMGRPAGTNIMELIAFSYGIDVSSIFEHAISIAIFKKPTISIDFFLHSPCTEMTGILYGQRKQSRILRLVIDNPKSSHHIAVNMGTVVPGLGDSNWSAIGTLTGRPLDVADDLHNIRIYTDQGECRAETGYL